MLLMTLCCYSQDYKVEKIKQLTKEKFKITRLFIVTDSVNNDKINTFISDFTAELNTKFTENNLQFACIRRGTADTKQKDSLMLKLNPDGVMKFIPTQFFRNYRGLTYKDGLYFYLGLSHRVGGIDNFTPLFQLKIRVMLDSFENSGKLAAQEFFEKISKLGYITPEM
jgi:hypothetical protein